MRMSDFLDAVTAAFRNLIDRELIAVRSDQYDAKAFGNAVVVLSGGNVFIRLVRDRGDVRADAASASFQRTGHHWSVCSRLLVSRVFQRRAF